MSITVIRSVLFMLWFAVVTTIMSVVFLPVVVLPRRATVWMARNWCRLTLAGLKICAGLDFEVRGRVPKGGVIVASKHMTMWDTLALYLLLDDPAMVTKRELFRIPFYGWFLKSAGSIAVNREGHAGALRALTVSAQKVIAAGRPVLIFPEGTRKKPGTKPDYKAGVAGLYNQLGVACAPVALNSGLYWTGPGGFLKKRGKVIVEFLPPIPAGLKRAAFMQTLQSRIEVATAALLREATTLPPHDGSETSSAK
jgi:1-acyl-sn-glycerol-3-phosphate acyltransferase